MLKCVPKDVTETLLFDTIVSFEKRNAPLEKEFLTEMQAQEQQQRQGRQSGLKKDGRDKIEGNRSGRSTQDVEMLANIEEGYSI
jgi:hypothetical protein